jgi:hypothetical protein
VTRHNATSSQETSSEELTSVTRNINRSTNHFFQKTCLRTRRSNKKTANKTGSTRNQSRTYKKLKTLDTLSEPRKLKKSNSKDSDKTLLLRAGDIESNPGPIIPEIQILEEQNMFLSFNPPETELFEINDFNFEEFAINPLGTEKIKERFHNYIYSCNCSKSLKECFKIFMTFYIKTRSNLSNTMITIINECLQRKRCAYCLEYTNNNLNKYLPYRICLWRRMRRQISK